MRRVDSSGDRELERELKCARDCDHMCIESSFGPMCACREGFRLYDDMRTCVLTEGKTPYLNQPFIKTTIFRTARRGRGGNGREHCSANCDRTGGRISRYGIVFTAMHTAKLIIYY